jgi:hypothetical protein
MAEGWGGNEKRVTKAPPKQHGGHRKKGGVVARKPKDEPAAKRR